MIHSTPSVMNSAARRYSLTYTGNSLQNSKKKGVSSYLRKIQNLEKKSEIVKKKLRTFFWKNPHFQKKSRNRKKNGKNTHFQKKLKNKKKNLGV